MIILLGIRDLNQNFNVSSQSKYLAKDNDKKTNKADNGYHNIQKYWELGKYLPQENVISL